MSDKIEIGTKVQVVGSPVARHAVGVVCGYNFLTGKPNILCVDFGTFRGYFLPSELKVLQTEQTSENVK